MDKEKEEQIIGSIRDFSLPRYDQIPNVGLYLEQTAKYVSEYLEGLGDCALTGSMISNYVKMGLVDNPVKKQYGRDQIAYLIFIAVCKSVLSMEDIRLLFELSKEFYSAQKAYEYFRLELENVLHYVFGLKDTLDKLGSSSEYTNNILRNVITAVAHKVYLEKYLTALRDDKEEK